MTLKLALSLGSVLVIASCSAAEAVGGGATPVAVSVSPARVALVAPASRTIELRNVGSERVVVDVASKALKRPATTNGWLRVRPARLVLRAHSRAVVTLRARANGLVRPGDHQLLLVLVARPVSRTRVPVRVRLGVRLRVRVLGRIVRQVAVGGVRVARRHASTRDLLVSVANRGNVTEQLGGRLTVTLVRAGRLVSRLRLGGTHELFPGTHGVVRMRYAGRARGPVTARVRVQLTGVAVQVERSYRIRL
jgi:hypothetical protein